jgi:hypothetical protein
MNTKKEIKKETKKEYEGKKKEYTQRKPMYIWEKATKQEYCFIDAGC